MAPAPSPSVARDTGSPSTVRPENSGTAEPTGRKVGPDRRTQRIERGQPRPVLAQPPDHTDGQQQVEGAEHPDQDHGSGSGTASDASPRIAHRAAGRAVSRLTRYVERDRQDHAGGRRGQRHRDAGRVERAALAGRRPGAAHRRQPPAGTRRRAALRRPQRSRRCPEAPAGRPGPAAQGGPRSSR